MKVKTFISLLFLFVFFLTISNCWAIPYITSIKIIPPNPTTDDSVTVLVEGMVPSSCHIVKKGSKWQWDDYYGNHFFILELSHYWVNEFCFAVVIPFSISFFLGKLEAQTYKADIVLVQHYIVWPPNICVAESLLSFTVSPKTYLPEDITPLPGKFKLLQNYPNPFNKSTVIGFTLTQSDFVSLEIFDLLGRRIKTLVSERLPAGYNSVIWDGTDDSGEEVASGIYLYELKSGELTETQKLMLLK